MRPRVNLLALTTRLSGALPALALLAACESAPASQPVPGPETTAASRVAPQPELEGRALFFGGRMEAEVLLGRGGFAPRGEARSAQSREGGDRGAFSGGAGSGGRRRGGGGGEGRGSGRREGGEGQRARSTEGGKAADIRPANAPPVQFRLRLSNHGTEPVVVEVPDFNSALGNFVVQPRSVTVAAGESLEVDPMTSRLGVTAEELPVTVALRTGGATERQVVTLRPKATGAPTAP